MSNAYINPVIQTKAVRSGVKTSKVSIRDLRSTNRTAVITNRVSMTAILLSLNITFSISAIMMCELDA